MEEATDFSEADKSTLMDESDDSGVIPGSHSENALHASEEEEAEGGKAPRYPGRPPYVPLPVSPEGRYHPLLVNVPGSGGEAFEHPQFIFQFILSS